MQKILELCDMEKGIKRMIGHNAGRVSFQESSAMIKQLAGLYTGSKQVERAAEALGSSMDGTGCPVRKEETEGRKGRQPDGSVKIPEVKLAVVFSADSRNKDGKPSRDTGSVSYNAAIESAAASDVDE